MHQIEYNAQRLEAMKLQMANESRRVYEDYLEALDKTKLQIRTLTTNGAVTFRDLTSYEDLLAAGFALVIHGLPSDFEFSSGVRLNAARPRGASSPSGADSPNTVLNTSAMNSYSAAAGIAAISNLTINSNNVHRTVVDPDLQQAIYGDSLTPNGGDTTTQTTGDTTGGKTVNGTAAQITNQAATVSSQTASVSGKTTDPDDDKTSGDSTGNSTGGKVVNGAAAQITNQTATVSSQTASISGKTTDPDDDKTSGDSTGNSTGGKIVNGGSTQATNISGQATSISGQTAGISGQTSGVTGQTTDPDDGKTSGDSTGNSTGGKIVNGGLTQTTNISGQAASLSGQTVIPSGKGGSTVTNDPVGGNTSDPTGGSSTTPTNGNTSFPIGGVTNISGLTGVINSRSIATNLQGTNLRGGVVYAPPVSDPPADPPVSDPPESDPPVSDPPARGVSSGSSVICRNRGQLIEAIKALFTGENGEGLDISGALDTNFEELLTNLINSGYITIIEKPAGADDFPEIGTLEFADNETSVATNTKLQEVSDEVELRKAEAKYEADMKRIDMKDRRYDSDLAALDNERNAIKQEMETLKTVAKENVERTFKLFG